MSSSRPPSPVTADRSPSSHPAARSGRTPIATLIGCVLCGGACIGVSAGTTFLPPSEYFCVEDSPFDLTGLGVTFFVEDCEDGLVNTPGLSTNGSVIGPGGITDSVDCDDGAIDGSGVNGHSIFGSGNPGLTFTFDVGALGALPTAVGLVWTDGSTLNIVTVEAFGPEGESLGTLVAENIGDGGFGSGTDEDRFFGVYSDGGISKFHIKNTPLGGGSGIEVDHIQYGAATVAPTCVADLNRDGSVDGADLGILLGGWGASGSTDLNGDGATDGADLGIMLGAWGSCPG